MKILILFIISMAAQAKSPQQTVTLTPHGTHSKWHKLAHKLKVGVEVVSVATLVGVVVIASGETVKVGY